MNRFLFALYSLLLLFNIFASINLIINMLRTGSNELDYTLLGALVMCLIYTASKIRRLVKKQDIWA